MAERVRPDGLAEPTVWLVSGRDRRVGLKVDLRRTAELRRRVERRGRRSSPGVELIESGEGYNEAG